MSTAADVSRGRLRRIQAGLLNKPRVLGTGAFTWADLLVSTLSGTQVYALYLPIDATVTDSLRIFGAHTSAQTRVDFWDAMDPHFSEALSLFGLRRPPALVLASGLPAGGEVPDTDALYCICFSDAGALADRQARVARSWGIRGLERGYRG